MKVKVVNKSKHSLPHYSTIASAGMDLRANIDKSITLKPLERVIVQTGIFIELPVGLEAQVRPRSGLAIKNGISVLKCKVISLQIGRHISTFCKYKCMERILRGLFLLQNCRVIHGIYGY